MPAGERLVVVAVAVLALSGCGDDDGGDGGEARHRPDVTERTPERAERIPVQRREAPPAGVAEQVSYFEIGDGGCPTEVDAPSVQFPADDREVEINEPYYICVLGFAPGRPIEVTVRRPDGREIDARLTSEGQFAPGTLPWESLPRDPVGRYSVTARQGATSANSSFDVQRASAPRLREIENFVAPGKPVRLGFAGFQPREEVRFHLYRERRPGSGRFSYLTSMTARMDENGEAIHEIATDPASPPVYYLARVTDKAQASFHVEEPPQD